MDSRNDNDGATMIFVIGCIITIVIWTVCENSNKPETAKASMWIGISSGVMITLLLLGVTFSIMDANYKAPEPVKVMVQNLYTSDIDLSSIEIQKALKAESDGIPYLYAKYEQLGTTQTNIFIWPLEMVKVSTQEWKVIYE